MPVNSGHPRYRVPGLAAEEASASRRRADLRVVLPGALVKTRTRDDYDTGREDATRQAGQPGQFPWFVRAHLESPSGELATSGVRTERGAAARAVR
jgi:hypothetical protein